jgi:hypothetical protein
VTFDLNDLLRISHENAKLHSQNMELVTNRRRRRSGGPGKGSEFIVRLPVHSEAR